MPATIHVTAFTTKTLNEWLESPVKKFHSARRIHTWKDGDIIVCTRDNKEIVVVGQVKGECKPCDLLDKEVYTGKDAKYNAYEFELAKYWILPKPVAFTEVAEYCGIQAGGKIKNNLCVGVAASHSKAFYNGEKPDEVLAKYYALVQSWMIEVRPPAPSAEETIRMQALLLEAQSRRIQEFIELTDKYEADKILYTRIIDNLLRKVNKGESKTVGETTDPIAI